MFPTRVLATFTLAKPVVPDGPLAVNLSILLEESKASSETVEFDTTEKTFFASLGITAKFREKDVSGNVSLPWNVAFKTKFPVAVGAQSAE